MNSQDSDFIVDIKQIPEIVPKKERRPFNSQYKEKIFYIWYNHGRPGPMRLLPYIPKELEEYGKIPSFYTLKSWIEGMFIPRADELDRQIKEQLDAMLMSEKIEMLKRHADLGVRMQDMAIEYLNENRDTLSSPAAVRLLVEGIRIERESKGIPAALDKMQNMTDEQLMEELKEIVTNSSVKLEELDANS